jgi:outer membrane protein OmpA-like peptidoglycan-associated protein
MTPPAAADQRAVMSPSLVVEKQWLQSWFHGTPVVIGQSSAGALSVDVPREFCFEPGRSNVKPPLAAVLDKVSQSLGRVPLARVSLLAAPDDKAATAPLALERANQVRKQLISHGVSAVRLSAPTAAVSGGVQLRITTTPP